MLRFLTLLLVLPCLAWADNSRSVNPSLLNPQQPATAPATAVKNGADDLIQDARQGWYFYLDPVKRQELENQAAEQTQPAPTPEQAQQDCTKSNEWTAGCGFVDPGKDFEFQAKQRDALMQRFAMEADNPKAVENYQRYQAWVTEKAITASNVWVYNQVNNPELDATVTSPISAFGLELARSAKSAAVKDLIGTVVNEGGRMLVFTRTDCKWCHSQYDLAKVTSQRYNLPLWTVALDGDCLGPVTQCIKGPLAENLAKELKVRIVPTIYVFIPANTWIRVSQGIVTVSSIEARMQNFLAAYRGALLESIMPDTPEARKVKGMDFNAVLKWQPNGNGKGASELNPDHD